MSSSRAKALMEEQPMPYQECNDVAWLGIAYVLSDVKFIPGIDYGMPHIMQKAAPYGQKQEFAAIS